MAWHLDRTDQNHECHVQHNPLGKGNRNLKARGVVAPRTLT